MSMQRAFFLSVSLFTLTLTQFIYSKEPMNKQKTLREFENIYDAILPAQEKNEEAFVWFSQIPHPLFNAVIHLSCEDVGAKVDAIMQQAPVSNPLSFWVHPLNRAEGLVAILQNRNFTSIITCPLMAWDVKPVEGVHGHIHPEDGDVFYEIIDEVYQLDPAVKREFKKLMDTITCENYVLDVEGKPISTGTLFMQSSVGGIFNDATLPGRREAAKEMMRFLMQRSHKLGLKRLIVLSSPEAEELYADLGFENVFNIEIYSR
jgi:N-acetylglutamate synthase-like GNAT family acetyltransferase